MRKYLIFIFMILLCVTNISCKEDDEIFEKPEDIQEDKSNLIDEKLDMFYNISYNYELSNDKIVKKVTTMFKFYGMNNNIKSTITNADFITNFSDGVSEEHLGKRSNTPTKTGVFYLISTKEYDGDIKSINGDVKYKIDGDDTEYVWKATQKVLNLSISDFSSGYVDEVTSASIKKNDSDEIVNIFKSISIEKTEENNDVKKLKTSFMLSESVTNKYCLDVQSFLVDTNGKKYNLAGFYNISNNLLLAHNLTSTISNSINIRDLYIRVNFIDENGIEHSFLCKQKYNL